MEFNTKHGHVKKSQYLIDVDCGMQIIPIFNLYTAGHLMDTQLLQPRHRQGRGQVGNQKVGVGKLLEDIVGNRLLALPLHCMLGDILVDECSAGLLPPPVGLGVVRGGQPAEVRGF
jgi:hypothetical protein